MQGNQNLGNRNDKVGINQSNINARHSADHSKVRKAFNELSYN